MDIQKNGAERLKLFLGKRVLISESNAINNNIKRHHYVLKPIDFESEFFEELLEGFDGTTDEDDNEINFKNYTILSCEDRVEISDSGDVQYVQVGDIYALHKKTGRIIHVEDGILRVVFNTIEKFMETVTLNPKEEGEPPIFI